MDSNLPESTIVSPALKQAAVPAVNNNKKIILTITGSVILLLILIGIGGYFFIKTKQSPPPVPVTPTPTPVAIEGAKFFLQSEPLTGTVGEQLKVSVFVKSDKDAANLFIAKIKFPNNMLQAKSINLRSEATSSGFIKDWFISNWVENTIDNNTGSASLVGGVPNPGFQTSPESSGSAMADVIFDIKAPGDAVISFDDTSAIYRNSDNANILFAKQELPIKITGVALTPTPEVSISPTPTPTSSMTPTPVSSPTATPTGPLEGDVNQDLQVDLQDLSVLLSLWGKKGSETLKADLNNDRLVNSFDYSRLVKILHDVGAVQ